MFCTTMQANILKKSSHISAKAFIQYTAKIVVQKSNATWQGC